jgi:hypothetical protein
MSGYGAGVGRLTGTLLQHWDEDLAQVGQVI